MFRLRTQRKALMTNSSWKAFFKWFSDPTSYLFELSTIFRSSGEPQTSQTTLQPAKKTQKLQIVQSEKKWIVSVSYGIDNSKFLKQNPSYNFYPMGACAAQLNLGTEPKKVRYRMNSIFADVTYR